MVVIHKSCYHIQEQGDHHHIHQQNSTYLCLHLSIKQAKLKMGKVMQIASFSYAEVKYSTGDIRYTVLWFDFVFQIPKGGQSPFWFLEKSVGILAHTSFLFIYLFVKLPSTRKCKVGPGQGQVKTGKRIWCYVTCFWILCGWTEWYVDPRVVDSIALTQNSIILPEHSLFLILIYSFWVDGSRKGWTTSTKV